MKVNKFLEKYNFKQFILFDIYNLLNKKPVKIWQYLFIIIKLFNFDFAFFKLVQPNSLHFKQVIEQCSLIL